MTDYLLVHQYSSILQLEYNRLITSQKNLYDVVKVCSKLAQNHNANSGLTEKVAVSKLEKTIYPSRPETSDNFFWKYVVSNSFLIINLFRNFEAVVVQNIFCASIFEANDDLGNSHEALFSTISTFVELELLLLSLGRIRTLKLSRQWESFQEVFPIDDLYFNLYEYTIKGINEETNSQKINFPVLYKEHASNISMTIAMNTKCASSLIRKMEITISNALNHSLSPAALLDLFRTNPFYCIDS